MKTFELDEAALKKGWGAEGQYWFIPDEYLVKEDIDFAHEPIPDDLTDDEILAHHGIIPYFNVKRVDLAKAYVETLSNKKLKSALLKFDGDGFIEAFWKYFHIYPKDFEGYMEFQNHYLLESAVQWCKDNNINYTIK